MCTQNVYVYQSEIPIHFKNMCVYNKSIYVYQSEIPICIVNIYLSYEYSCVSK